MNMSKDSNVKSRTQQKLERDWPTLGRVGEVAREILLQEDRLPRRDGEEWGGIETKHVIPLGKEGLPAEEVIEHLRRILRATPSSAGRCFFNQLFGGRDAMATLAEMLAPLLNTSMYTFKVAGPQVLIEGEVLRRMASAVGYRQGEGMFAPGGSLSNLSAMIIARNEAVKDARENGMSGEPLKIYVSQDAHYSTRKGAGMIGIGRKNVREVPVDGRGRMEVSALSRLIAEDREQGQMPLMIVATAGTTVLGAFDPIRELAEVAGEEGMWLHVDGALGGSVLLCREHRHLLDGSELSDSFTWNAHKMMGVPLSCSVLLLKSGGLLEKNFNEKAEYLFQADRDELNPGTRSIQCGRRNDALKLWAAWKHHGDRGYDARIGRLFDLAGYAASRIEAEPELRLVRKPESINVCFEFPGCQSEEICRKLDEEGRLKIGHGVVEGRSAIRLVCIDPDLSRADIDEVLEKIQDVAGSLLR